MRRRPAPRASLRRERRLCAVGRSVDPGADRLSGSPPDSERANRDPYRRQSGRQCVATAARRRRDFTSHLQPVQSRSRTSAGRSTGPPHPLTIGHSQVAVRLDDEAARVNPNLASPALMEALLRAVGSDPDSARRLAAAIADWVGSAPTPRPQAASLRIIARRGSITGRPARRSRPWTNSAACSA